MTPVIEIITTGNELLEGLYADTNSRLISARLFEWGWDVIWHTTVGDDVRRAEQALQAAAARADIVILTGGLGPTADDCNRDAVAAFTRRPLRRDAKAEEWIRDLFRRRGRTLPENNLKQADIPEGARTLYNTQGTAAGFIVPGDRAGAGARPAIIALPGPRREWLPMLEGPVREFLLSCHPERTPRRVLALQTTGVPESEVDERIRDLWTADPRVRLTLLSEPMLVTVRIVAGGGEPETLDALLDDYRAQVVARLGEDNILGEGGISHEEAVGRVFRDKGLTLCVAESCTGGMISAALTAVPGSSAYVRENFVTYGNEAKIRRLGVRPETLADQGAVSAECAAEMAAGALRESGADVALAVTGIAGPTGASPDKPVGLVFIALADGRSPAASRTHRCQFVGDRAAVRLWTTRTALDLLRRWALSR
ncbi:MAG: competence/damage-inducible protein A [Candidatus Sumerlaeia bacterium]